MKIRRFINLKTLLAAVAILAVIFFSSIINFIVNIQWFREVNYLGTYLTRVFARLWTGIPIFIAVFIILYSYMAFLRREYAGFSTEIYAKDRLRRINAILLSGAFIISILVSYPISSNHWQDILMFIYGVPFSIRDPLFNMDVGFYMFKLPLLKTIYNMLLNTIIVLTVATSLFYLFIVIKTKADGYRSFYGVNRARPRYIRDIIDIGGKRLSLFGGAIFVMSAIGFVFKNFDLVYSSRGVAFGASYTDMHVSFIFNWIMVCISLLAASSVALALYRRKFKMFVLTLAGMLLAVVIQGGCEYVVQRFVVSPNIAEKEKAYISYNIKFTRSAFGLDKIEEQDFPANDDLTKQDVENNEATIGNIRINDFEPALEVYNQMQGIKQYYRFNDIDIDRYNIDGKYVQTFMSARELDQRKLQNVTWQNKHMYYTHGYGTVMSPVNTVTAEGQPSLIIKDIPVVSSAGIKIDRPEIYFGELTDDYIITNTGIKELNYPSGSNNEETTYGGKAGIGLGGMNRVLFAINRGSMNLLLSQDITSRSRIIMNRNIKTRVEAIAPFLKYDGDPYIAAVGGRLYWIMDAYTTSSLYPYSEPYEGINYIRNSIKVIIDAYDGTVNFYLIDGHDPVAETYSRMFPGLFKSANELPDGFAEHLRYPEGIFDLQLQVYKKYHVTNPKIFYNREDEWIIAGEDPSSQDGGSTIEGTRNKGRAVEPSYVVMKLPGGVREEFTLISYYTPPGRDNMASWLGARMDGGDYGKLIVYKFPKDKVTYGPSQFKSRVNQDTTISKEISLWDQQGSNVEIGSVIMVPIEKSLLYVTPVYIRSTGTNSIPEMKRVVLGYGDRIVMEDTLDKALADMFNLKGSDNADKSQQQINTPGGASSGMQQLIEKANDAFKKAKEAQQSGNWAEYGTRLKELESILKQLDAAAKE